MSGQGSAAIEAATGARLLPDTDPGETRRQWTSWIAYQAADPDQRAKFPIFASIAAEIRIEVEPASDHQNERRRTP